MISYLIIGLIAIMYVVDLVITLINYKNRTQPIPEIARDIYDREKYTKWLNYFMEDRKSVV